MTVERKRFCGNGNVARQPRTNPKPSTFAHANRNRF